MKMARAHPYHPPNWKLFEDKGGVLWTTANLSPSRAPGTRWVTNKYLLSGKSFIICHAPSMSRDTVKSRGNKSKIVTAFTTASILGALHAIGDVEPFADLTLWSWHRLYFDPYFLDKK